MKEIPEIKTTRLLLKAVRLKDVEDIFTYVKNTNVLQYTPATTPRELANTEAYIRGIVKQSCGVFTWAIRSKDCPEVVGLVDFDIKDGTRGSTESSVNPSAAEVRNEALKIFTPEMG